MPSSLPTQQQLNEFGWGAVEYQCVRARVGSAVEGDEDVGVDLEVGAAGLRDLAEDRPQRVVVLRGDEDQIGTARGELVDRQCVSEGRDDGLALRRTRGDRRPLDREVLAGEVDVVQLVAVDEASGGDVADDGVVLPAVPEPADHLDGVGGLVEQVSPADVAAAEQLGLVCGAADPHLPAGPAVGDEVKCGNGFRDVERLGVGDGGDGDQPDVVRHRRHPRGDQHRVGSARQPARLDLGHGGAAER